MRVGELIEGYKALRSQAPEVPSARFALRLFAWQVCRLLSMETVIPLHRRSRMRIKATRNEHGIQTAIYLFRHHYEPSVGRAIDAFVRDSACCYDIGANLGLWTLRMAEAAGPNGLVYAFEPNPAVAAELAYNARLSGHDTVRVCEYGLGAADSSATLFVPKDIGRASLASETAEDSTVAVTLRSLDSVWQEQGCPDVAFVKMDVEGAEPLVLRGGTRFFSSVRPVVCCELNPGKLGDMGFVPQDVLGPLLSWGYSAKVWSGTALIDCATRTEWSDVEDLVLVPPHRSLQSLLG